jgi:hypothetical protein
MSARCMRPQKARQLWYVLLSPTLLWGRPSLWGQFHTIQATAEVEELRKRLDKERARWVSGVPAEQRYC